LIIGHAAKTALERERDQWGQPLGNKRHAVDHYEYDRNDGSQRPGNDTAGLGAAAALGFEKTGLLANVRLCRRIE
jgi:hypothetical protein